MCNWGTNQLWILATRKPGNAPEYSILLLSHNIIYWSKQTQTLESHWMNIDVVRDANKSVVKNEKDRIKCHYSYRSASACTVLMLLYNEGYNQHCCHLHCNAYVNSLAPQQKQNTGWPSGCKMLKVISKYTLQPTLFIMHYMTIYGKCLKQVNLA